MTFAEILKKLVESQCSIDFYRAFEPNFIYNFDGAEGIEFWCYNREQDTFSRHFFTLAQMLAEDWQVSPGPAQST